MTQHSDLSIQLTKDISKMDKQQNGIFFTSPKTVSKNIEYIKQHLKNSKTVLEPSCGSCEYINQIHAKFPHLDITGVEFNNTIYDSVKAIENEKVTILHEDYLTYESNIKYDVIIGNPPFFVMKKSQVDKSYHKYFNGRPNIFILFIIKSLRSLANGGLLSFILPANFLNCLYYDKTRKYIADNFTILKIIESDGDFIDTTQDTIILIIKNELPKSNKPNIVGNNPYTIFGTIKNVTKLESYYDNTTTLKQMGFKVTVGKVVWNQCKDILTDDDSKTLLIYSSDIKNKKIDTQPYSNKDKKNFIDKEGNSGPILVINRGYGVGTYKFEYCLIDIDREYQIENHLICIVPVTEMDNVKQKYSQIVQSFENDKTLEFIKLYFGNNAINTTELCELLPIYLCNDI